MEARDRVVASISDDSWIVECSGDLDARTAGKLHSTISWCLGTSNLAMELDLTETEGLSREGLSVILNGMVVAHEGGVPFRVLTSRTARIQLDEAGLWWVGVVDDGIAAELAMGDAFQDHLDEHRPG